MTQTANISSYGNLDDAFVSNADITRNFYTGDFLTTNLGIIKYWFYFALGFKFLMTFTFSCFQQIQQYYFHSNKVESDVIIESMIFCVYSTTHT